MCGSSVHTVLRVLYTYAMCRVGVETQSDGPILAKYITNAGKLYLIALLVF